MSYTICNNVVTTAQITTFRNKIDSIITAAAGLNGNVIDSNIILETINQLKTVDNDISDARVIVNDCINNFKKSMNQPVTNYDDKNTSYVMLKESQIIHEEIIYNRIQLVIYIILICVFYDFNKNNP